MIEHVVLFNLKPGIDAEKIEWMLRETRIRLLKIPEVRALRCGYRIDPGKDWSLFLLIELDSPEKLTHCMNNPVHLGFLDEVIKPNITDRISLDYQTDASADPLLS